MNLTNIIKEELNKYIINEVRYINTRKNWRDADNQSPIHNNENIRVFHGCSMDTAIKFAKNGISAQEFHPRRFSYENGMNPVGLFVSTDFMTAKGLSSGVIIEFTVNTSDLDYPVWKGQDTYFGQNSNPIPFSSEEERNAQKQHYMDISKNDESEYVRNSDNPALANSIFKNNEHQALFVGNLNPNQIKRFWVKNNYNSYKKYDRNSFIKVFDKDTNNEEQSPVFMPNDDFTNFEDAANRIGSLWDFTPEDLKSFFNDENLMDKEMRLVLRHFFYPKQIIQIIGKDKYNKYFGFKFR